MDFPPNGWKLIKFDDFTTLQRGKDLTKSDFKAGTVPVAGSNGLIGYHNEAFVKAPGVTVGRSGSCGKVTFYGQDFWAHNTSLYVRDFHGNDEKFAYYFLDFLNLGRFRTGASVPTLDRNSFKDLPITIQQVGEQKAIAQILSLVQTAIEQQERFVSFIRELKFALMQKLFTEGLYCEKKKQTEIGFVPQSWKVVELGSIGKIGNGSTPKRDNARYWDKGSIPWLTSGKIHELNINQANEFITELAVKECHLPLVKAGSLLLAITGQGKTLGNSALVGFDTYISQHLAYVQFTTQDVHSEYVLWYMQTRYQHLRSIAQAGGSTKGALTCGYLKTYLVPLPPLSEQIELAKIFSMIYKNETAHLKKKKMLIELFQTILHQLMTGTIRVTNITLPNIDNGETL